MHMFHRNSQCDKLIHEPCDIDEAFIFRNNHQVISFSAYSAPNFTTKESVDLTACSFHQTTVTRNSYNSISLKIQLKSTGSFLYRQRYMDIATLNFRTFKTSKKGIIQYKFIST